MKLNIGSHIYQLLFNYDSVAIPGLGSLVASYKPSYIDHVQGILHAPSKSLSFEKNEDVENDHVLIDFISQHNGITKEKATTLLEAFVDEVKSALEKREIVVFDQVGRLYMDYEQTLQFLQESVNFNTTTYGLPSVQFYPILRSKTSIFEASEAPGPVAFEVQHERKPARWKIRRKDLQTAAPVLFLLLVSFCSIYFFVNRNEDRFLGAQKLPVAETRLNKKPSLDYASFLDGFQSGQQGTITSPAVPELPAEEEEKPAPPVDEDGAYETEIDTESITLGPNQKEGVVIVGAFGKKRGVEKRIKQIYVLGYDAFQDKVNGLTRVGVQFVYETEREKLKILSIMREEFDESAYLLKK